MATKITQTGIHDFISYLDQIRRGFVRPRPAQVGCISRIAYDVIIHLIMENHRLKQQLDHPEKNDYACIAHQRRVDSLMSKVNGNQQV